MKQLFISILNLGVAGSYAILFVIAARFLLKKTPKIFSYVLWTVVLFRLVCPLSFSTPYSLVPATVFSSQIQTIIVPENFGVEVVEVQIPDDYSYSINNESPVVKQGTEVLKLKPSYMDIATWIWAVGIVVLFVYSAGSYLFLKRRLRTAEPLHSNVLISDKITTPFVLGMLHPQIYLPKGLDPQAQQYILLHEKTHIRRLDYLIKPIAFMTLTLHWFNPLVWTAFIMMSRDMEMSCDEAVIRQLDKDVKKEYSLSLLKMASRKTMFNASPLAFSDHNVKSRIINVLNYKKPTFWLITVAALVITSLSLGLISNPKTFFNKEEILTRLNQTMNGQLDEYTLYSDVTEDEVNVVGFQRQFSVENIGGAYERFNKVFLIFNDKKLETVYFRYEYQENHQYNQTMTLEKGKQLAKDFVKQIFNLNVNFTEGKEGSGERFVGAPYEFIGQAGNQPVYVNVDLVQGVVLYASLTEVWQPDAEYYSSQDQETELVVTDDLVILTKNQIPWEIWPHQENQAQYSFNQTTVSLSSDQVQWMKGTETEILQQINYSVFRNAEFFVPVEKIAMISVIQKVTLAREDTEFLEHNLFTERFKQSAAGQKSIQRYQQIIGYIQDNLMERMIENSVLNINNDSSLSGDCFRFDVTYYLEENQSLNCSYYFIVIEEDGIFKIDEMVIQSPFNQEVHYQDSPEKAAEVIVDALNQRNFQEYFALIKPSADKDYHFSGFYYNTYSNWKSVDMEQEEGHAVITLEAYKQDDQGTMSKVNAYLCLYQADENDQSSWISQELIPYVPNEGWWHIR